MCRRGDVFEEKKKEILTSINDRYNILTSHSDRCAVFHSEMVFLSHGIRAKWFFYFHFNLGFGVWRFQLTIFCRFRSWYVKERYRGNPFFFFFETISSDWIIVRVSAVWLTNIVQTTRKMIWTRNICGQAEEKSRQKREKHFNANN